MKRTVVLYVASLALALTSSVGQAALSGVDVIGTGSVDISGGHTGITIWEPPSTDLGFTWISVLANDPADAVSTVDSGTFERVWEVGSFRSGEGNTTTFTINFSLDQNLITDNVGDSANEAISVTLELRGQYGTLVSANTFSLDQDVADGSDHTVTSAGSVSVTSSTSLIDGSNWGYTLRLTASADVEAFTAVVPDPEPTVPAPGAVVLGGLGVGLVGWMRRRSVL